MAHWVKIIALEQEPQTAPVFAVADGIVMNLSSPRFVASETQASCDLNETISVLHLDTGVYYTFDAIGSRIWSLLQTPRTIAELRDQLAAEYDVSSEVCQRDIAVLLTELLEKGLVRLIVGQDAGVH